MLKTCLTLFAVLVVISSCNKDEGVTMPESIDTPPNILFIIADDMGLDATPGYSIGDVKPNMPTLQSFIDSGIRFSNFWVYPTCTPTRSSILTGKYGFRTDVLNVGDELSTNEVSLQSYINSNSVNDYSNAVIGKWHLSNSADHPTEMGIEFFAGLLTGGVQSYTNWNLTENGETNSTTEYSTTKFTDLAIDWVDKQDKPWFLWLAYNAPHTPIHLPPAGLHSQGDLPSDQESIDANPLPYYMAMMEAMDTEMERLLSSLSESERENTLIIFIGDNGTLGSVSQEYNSNRTKGSVYQGGINVPMVVSGKTVTRINEVEDALINSTDLFATIAEFSGIDVNEINDSKSFMDLFTSSNTEVREYVYSEIGSDTGGSDYTIRNSTHKYILFEDGTEALFDLSNNFFERPNLLSETQLPLSTANSTALQELVDKVTEIRSSN